MERLANLPNTSSDSNLAGLTKFYDEIQSHARYLDSLDAKSYSHSKLLVPMVMGKLLIQLKLVVSRNLRSELWDLVELLNLINIEIKIRANCGEYNISLNFVVWEFFLESNEKIRKNNMIDNTLKSKN